MEPVKIAMTLQRMVISFGELAREMETLIKSEEIPKSERDYHIAKEKACAVLKSESIPVGEMGLRIKGLVADELFRRDCALYKYNGLRCRIDILGKQMSAYQSVGRHFDSEV